jgi:hypothetical protein
MECSRRGVEHFFARSQRGVEAVVRAALEQARMAVVAENGRISTTV